MADRSMKIPCAKFEFCKRPGVSVSSAEEAVFYIRFFYRPTVNARDTGVEPVSPVKSSATSSWEA